MMSLFITFDGPNGVGKSTLINALYEKLLESYPDTIQTAEPTDTELGKFTRVISEKINAESLACLVAADRYEHVSNVICPAMDTGKIVLCDRYLASSLVLQRMDGVALEFILSINEKIKKPDLYFILTASAAELTKRLGERQILTRFEKRKEYQEIERKYYKECVSILRELGIKVCEIDMEQPLNECIGQAYAKIVDILKENENA